MASQTSALPDGSTLTKPAYTDSADIAVINTNMDKIVSNINAENQALATLDAKTEANTKYINDTSKTGFQHIQDDFANIGDRAIQFYSIRPSDNNLLGYIARFNQNYGDGIFEDIVTGKAYKVNNINGTWSMDELALKSDLTYQYGNVTITGDGSGWKWETVTFDNPYVSEPLVSAFQYGGGYAQAPGPVVRNMSRTGFQVGMYGFNGTVAVRWSALGST